MSLPSGSYQPAEVTYRDAGNEKGTCRFYGPELDDTTFIASVALWNTLLSKMDAITLGARTRDVYNDESIYTTAQPTNGAARETRLLVTFRDTVNGKIMHTSIPTLDPTTGVVLYVINESAKDVVRLDAPTPMAEFIAAFNAFAVNPETGNAVAVVSVDVVGRNI